MPRIIRLIPAVAVAALLLVGAATPAFAIFPQLHSTLSGAAINGVVPQGEAKLDQSGYPVEPSRLEVRVRNVNLPDGAVLTVTIEGTPVGTITLSRTEGRLATTILFQVGRQSPITVERNGAVILRGTWLS
jgi:hypothetical protein